MLKLEVVNGVNAVFLSEFSKYMYMYRLAPRLPAIATSPIVTCESEIAMRGFIQIIHGSRAGSAHYLPHRER